FHATDTKGNVEADKTLDVRLDKTKPILTVQPIKIAFANGTLGSGDSLPVALSNWLGDDPPAGTASGLAAYRLRRSLNGSAFIILTLSSPLATTDSRTLAPGNTFQ